LHRTGIHHASRPQELRYLLTIKENQIMNRLKKIISTFLNDECGQDLIEYALVAALIALGATAAMNSLAGTISTTFSTVGSKLAAAV
jgi:pilus assembly protein Flp/PilA